MSFVTELKRRNVFRAALAYLAVAWLVIQIGETILPSFGFDASATRVLVICFGVAFFPVLIFAWTFEFTAEGFKLDRDVVQSSKDVARSGKSFDRVLIVLLVLALSYFAFDKFLLSPSRESAAVEAVREQATTEALDSAKASAFDRSVAVLSFTNSSNDPSNDYLSEGLSDELRDRLAQLPSMRVVARSSSIRFRDQALDATVIASQLGVSRVIEGRFNRQGNRIVLSVQLIDAISGFQLWSQSFERSSRDLMLLQQDLARALANQLAPALSYEEEIFEPSAQQISAHDLLLLGRQFEQQVTDQQLVDESILRKAIDYYRLAIAQDSQFAEAHARLGKMLLYVGNIDEELWCVDGTIVRAARCAAGGGKKGIPMSLAITH